MISVAVLIGYYRAYVRLPVSHRGLIVAFFTGYAGHTVRSFVRCQLPISRLDGVSPSVALGRIGVSVLQV